MRVYRLPPRRPTGPRGWLNRVVASLAAGVALLVSFFLGALVFLTALGLMVLVVVGVMIRVWWLRRQIRAQIRDADDDGDDDDGNGVIEGEYIVVERHRRNRRERR